MYANAVRSFFSDSSAVAETKEFAVAKRGDGDYFSKFKYATPRQGSKYFSSSLSFQRDNQRRRKHGGGRHRSCIVLREMLAMWYSSVRHSVDVKIMCRFPKKVLLVKALMLQQDYYASCLANNVAPERVQLNGNWLRDWLDERGLTLRQPNRKFKVPRLVLAERLKIWWVNTARLRKLVMLHLH